MISLASDVLDPLMSEATAETFSVIDPVMSESRDVEFRMGRWQSKSDHIVGD